MMTLSRAVCVVVFLAGLHLPFAAFAAGTARPATHADLQWMHFAGFQNPAVGMLVNPDDPNVGQAVGEAKQWLAQHAARGVNVRCLEPQFAQRLKSFMEAVPGGPPTITSAYRSIAEQQAIMSRGDGATRVSTPCGSYHPWGLAADFNQIQSGSAQQQWMRANAASYGLGRLGDWDPNHYQNLNGKVGQCGACGSTGSDGVLPPASASPSAGIANAFRQLFGQPQQPVLPRPLPAAAQQPLAQQQSPLNSFVPMTPILQPALNPPTNTPTTPSIADQLEELAFGEKKPIVTTTGTSVPIYVSGSDAAQLTSTQNQNPTVASTTPVYAPGIVTTQTFTSGDLAWEVKASESVNGTRYVLATMRAILERLVEILTPFNAAPGSIEIEEFVEEEGLLPPVE